MLKTILARTDPLTTESVVDQILLDEEQQISDSGSTASTFFAKAKRGRRDQHEKCEHNSCDKPEKKKTCMCCQFNGHNITECRKLKKELEDAKSNSKKDNSSSKSLALVKLKPKKASAKLAIADDNSDNSASDSSSNTVHVMISLYDYKDVGNQWIMDSGMS
jgi:hypothetical protein